MGPINTGFKVLYLFMESDFFSFLFWEEKYSESCSENFDHIGRGEILKESGF